jgi:hypothetical protein
VLDTVERRRQQRRLTQQLRLGEQPIQPQLHVLGVDVERLAVARKQPQQRVHAVQRGGGGEPALVGEEAAQLGEEVE